MAMGVILYFVYVNIPFLAPTKPFVAHAIDIVQPVLIFLMLFLTFCKINVHDLKLCAWHWRLLLIQEQVSCFWDCSWLFPRISRLVYWWKEL